MPRAMSGGGGGDVVSVDAVELRDLSTTAHQAAQEIVNVQQAAGGIIGGLDGRGWDLGAVQARWASVRGNMIKLTTDLDLQALDLRMRVMWVESFENGMFGSTPAMTLLQDPVNSATGNLVHTEVDLALPTRGRLPLRLERTYNSRDNGTGVFGRGWTSNLDCCVQDCGELGAVVRRSDGRRDAFVLQSDGSYAPPNGVHDRLERERGAWRLTQPNGTCFQFGRSGRLETIEDRNHNTLSLERDAFNRVTELRDAAGRAIHFFYEQERLATATDTADRTWSYTFTDSGSVASVTGPSGAIVRYTYDAHHRLATITDALDRVVLASTYDDLGRVVDQRTAGGATSHFSYTGDESSGLTTTLTDPRGSSVRVEHNANGLVTRLTDAAGGTVRYTYTPQSEPETLTDRLGHRWTYTTTAEGKLASVTDPLGAVTQFEYSAAGDLIQRIDALGNTWHYAYDERRNLVSVTTPSGGVWHMAYDRFGQVVHSLDPDGMETAATYDTSGLVVALISESGARHFGYDAAGHLQTAVDTSAATTTFGYDAAGRCVSVRNALGYTTSWEYDVAGQLIAETDPSGARTTASNDADRRLVSVVNNLGGRREFTYDPNGNLTAYTDPSGSVTRIAYDALDRVAAVSSPRGDTWRFDYDANGNRVGIADPRGGTQTRVFDAVGRLTARTDATGATTTLTRDARGSITTLTDAIGAQTTYTYDAEGRPITRTDPLGGRTRLEWTPAGRLRAIKDAHGHQAHFEYDRAGRMLGIRYADGSRTSVQYDAVGNLAAWTDAAGATTRLEYNALRAVIAQTDALGNRVEFDYESRGRLVEVREDGTRTRFEYDSVGNLTAVVDALGNATRYAYDPRGLLTRVIDANRHSRDFAYDASGRLFERIDALGMATHLSRDANGNIVQVDHPDGGRTELAYDAANRPIRLQTSDGLQLAAEYDALGRWTELRGGLGVQRRTYDALGRVVRAVDTHDRQTEYEYDAAGLLTRLVYPDGTPLELIYGDMDRLAEVRDAELGTFRLGYGPQGLPLWTELPNGVRWELTRDLRGRVCSMREVSPAGEAATTFTYAYDARNNIVSVQDNGDRIDYAYDLVSRLTLVRERHGDTRFTYDSVGNRINTLLPHGTEVAARYNAADQLVALADETHFAYDARGNLIERQNPDGSRVRYRWDCLGRLTGIQSAALRRGYAYDALGLLVREQRDDHVRTYTHDSSGGLARVLNIAEDGTSVRRLYGVSRSAVAQGSAGHAPTFTVSDLRGSVRGVEDASGRRLQRSDYDAWGNGKSSSNTAIGAFGFGGEPQDPVTGLVYLRARWYDPSTGRFLSRDPLPGSRLRPTSQHAYAYAHDNPVSLVDPSGLSASGAVALPGNLFPGNWPFGEPPIPGLGGSPDIFGSQVPGLDASGVTAWPPTWPDISLAVTPAMSAYLERRLSNVEFWYQLATKYGKLADSMPDPWGGFRDVSRLAETAPEDVRSVYADLRDLWIREGGAPGPQEDSVFNRLAAEFRAEAQGLHDAMPFAEPLARAVPVVSGVLDAVFSGLDQWDRSGSLPTPRRIAQAVATGGTTAVLTGYGTDLGLAACSPIDASGVGVVIDAGCGAAGGLGGRFVAAPVVNQINSILAGSPDGNPPSLPHLGPGDDPITQLLKGIWGNL